MEGESEEKRREERGGRGKARLNLYQNKGVQLE